GLPCHRHAPPPFTAATARSAPYGWRRRLLVCRGFGCPRRRRCRRPGRGGTGLHILPPVHHVPARRRQRSLEVVAGGAVDLLPQDVRVARVPRRLLDHVDVDPAQRHLTQAAVRGGVVQPVGGGDPPGLLARPVVLGQQVGDRDVVRHLPARLTAGGLTVDLLG